MKKDRFIHPIWKLFQILTPGDKILIAALLLSSLFLSFLLFFNTQAGKIAIISVNGKEIKRLNLSEEQQLEFTGAQGRFVVQVQEHAIKMLESTCPGALCCQMGSINKPNQVIVCVPNRVIIRIEGGSADEHFDLITE